MPPPSRETNLALIARDPTWFPHRYDPGEDVFHLVRLDRAAHDRASFLTDAYLPAEAPRLVLGRRELRDKAMPSGPVHFLFHSAFCCSTLVTRLLDRPGVAMALREPMVLQDVVAFRRTGAPAPRVAAALADSMALLARPFAPGEAVVVKPSNLLNAVAGDLLDGLPAARALLLHAPLRTFLVSIAKQGLWGRTGVRQLMVALCQDGVAPFGFDGNALMGQTDLQVAALGWLMQQALFATLAARFGPSRVATLDSETLLARPADAVERLAALFALPIDRDRAAEIAGGKALRRHSKSGVAFDPQARANEYDDAAALHGDEIDKVTVWAEAVAASAGLALDLPAPLLPR
jgi:hypothetical protein